MSNVRKLLSLPDEARRGRRVFGFHETFDHLVSADRWTKIAPNSGTILVGDAQGGVCTLIPSDGSVVDNDEVYLHTTHELFLFDDGKPLMTEAYIKYVEANTDDANVIFGLVSAPAANALLDNGGGPPASYSGAVIFKVDGGTKWQCESSQAGVQTTDATDETAGGASYTRLRIEVQTGRGTNQVDIIFYINDLIAREDGSVRQDQRVIKHEGVSISSATEMSVIIGAKNGDGNNENLLVKYISAWQNYDD